MTRADRALELVSNRADALVVHNIYNIRYISGFTNDTAVLYISPLRKVLLTDFRFLLQAKEEAKEFEIYDIAGIGYPGAIERLSRLDGVSSLAFESGELSYRDYLSYKRTITASLEPIDEEINSLREIKTAEEIEYLSEAERIGDVGFWEILKFIQPGVSELEIAAKLEYIMKCNGAEKLSFDTIAASGPNSAIPHAMPSERKLMPGDFLTLDFGCTYKGYCSDMTRTVVLGKASDRQREVYDTVLKAQLAVCSEISAGKVCREMDALARNIITEAGYGENFGHGLGHSVGLFIHENPACNKRDESVLKPGMIMTVEPGIYIDGFGGVRIEDMVVITEKGCRNLAHSPKELLELPL